MEVAQAQIWFLIVSWERNMPQRYTESVWEVRQGFKPTFPQLHTGLWCAKQRAEHQGGEVTGRPVGPQIEFWVPEAKEWLQ